MTDSPFGLWTQESDHAQSRRISELTGELESLHRSLQVQNRTASALRSDLASLRGSIETRLTRLSEAFDAFVELSSLRDQLSLVAGPALVRQAARARLVALGTPAGGDGPVLDVSGAPAAPGYWLADAVAALGPDDEGAAQRAAAIDLRRTATFLTVAGAACGRADLVARWAPDALGTLDATRPVTRAQRVLWLAAAEGRLGPAARTALVERLTAAVADVPDATAEEAVAAWTEQLKGPPYRGSSIAGAPEVAEVRRGADGLGRLQELMTPPPAAAGTDAAGDAPADDPGPDPLVTELVDVLRALIDEGAEQESHLMARVAELEAVVTGQEAPGPPWDAATDDLLALLRADALERRDPVGDVARAACAPWVLRAADRLLATAEVPAPEVLEATAAGLTLRARAGRAEVEGTAQALARASTPPQPVTPRSTRLTAGLTAGTALLWVMTAMTRGDAQWLLVVSAFALTITVGARGTLHAVGRRNEAERAARAVAAVRREADRLLARVESVTAEIARHRHSAQESHAQVRAGLTTTPGGTATTPGPAPYGDPDGAPVAGPRDALPPATAVGVRVGEASDVVDGA
ncbi:hypothetical protein J1G42_16760 [Cellulomonas sp. zg-ZUI222]|uniref:hypothetical protein n=1 Tax=Cellulomonas wangleii TaxID=2816956 RepID=UPI001A94D2BB|nr:hypothetical protein [Cellulomonas wangleii]MBO0922474.1 hypothetical protein [Cellulomonas wangleii]